VFREDNKTGAHEEQTQLKTTRYYVVTSIKCCQPKLFNSRYHATLTLPLQHQSTSKSVYTATDNQMCVQATLCYRHREVISPLRRSSWSASVLPDGRQLAGETPGCYPQHFCVYIKRKTLLF